MPNKRFNPTFMGVTVGQGLCPFPAHKCGLTLALGWNNVMHLRLQFAPTPDNAARLAELAVSATRNINGIELDYTPASLAHVDEIIGRFHEEGLTPEQMGETIFSFGCYIGEVLVRNNSGIWKVPPESISKVLGLAPTGMVVELPNDTIWNPIGKAFKLLANGSVDSASYFYTIATKDA